MPTCAEPVAGAKADAEPLSSARRRLAFKKESFDLAPRPFAFGRLVGANPATDDQVVLALSDHDQPVYLTDRAGSMHVHVIGQTGSGKTRSVIEPLVLQDLYRGRGVLVIDGNGSEENEERLASMAEACGRLAEVKIFILNPSDLRTRASIASF